MNKSTGNMYGFVTHTWNPIRGKCSHDCSYCYMKGMAKRFPDKLGNPIELVEKELEQKFQEGQFIFVGSSSDVFAEDVPESWIWQVITCCAREKAKFLFHTKNPLRMYEVLSKMPLMDNIIICGTIETHLWIEDIMGRSPKPLDRILALKKLSDIGYKIMVTIEPIIDFDLDGFLPALRHCNPFQVNIGADSGKNNLPEPSKEKLLELIEGLESFTKVVKKNNLERLL